MVIAIIIVLRQDGDEKMALNQQENLEVLREKIEKIRVQLHLAYQNNRTFSDPDVYHLSLYLDDLIAEYQSCCRLHHLTVIKHVSEG